MATFANLPRRTRIGGVLLVSTGLGFAAHGAVASMDQRRVPATPVAARPTGYEADDHFPGALNLLPAGGVASSAAGSTGTAPLPAIPDTVRSLPSGDASVRPARPFLATGSALDRARALQCLTNAVYYEAASEPDAGQRAVAQVVLNRVRHPAFPATVCGVVFQGSDGRGCQFSFACDGAMARAPVARWWNRARSVAARALAGDVFAPVGLATHYHTYAVTPSWNRSLVMTGMFGAHLFHRWKGYWGTPAAFLDRYRGHEPMAGPVLPLPSAPTALPPVPAPVPAPDVPALPNTATQTPAASLPTPPVEADRLPVSPILDRWKDSGKPIR